VFVHHKRVRVDAHVFAIPHYHCCVNASVPSRRLLPLPLRSAAAAHCYYRALLRRFYAILNISVWFGGVSATELWTAGQRALLVSWFVVRRIVAADLSADLSGWFSWVSVWAMGLCGLAAQVVFTCNGYRRQFVGLLIYTCLRLSPLRTRVRYTALATNIHSFSSLSGAPRNV